MTNGDLRERLVVTRIPPEYDPGGFDCGEPDLTEYLADGTALSDEQASVSRCYLIHTLEGALVGYFAVLADSIRLKTKERPSNMAYSTAPALKLGRMGVDQRYRGLGHRVGEWILDYVVGLAREISRDVGVRYVTLDALDRERLVAWYAAYGFKKNEGEHERMRAVRMKFKRWKAGDVLHTVSMRFDILLEDEI